MSATKIRQGPERIAYAEGYKTGRELERERHKAVVDAAREVNKHTGRAEPWEALRVALDALDKKGENG